MLSLLRLGLSVLERKWKISIWCWEGKKFDNITSDAELNNATYMVPEGRVCPLPVVGQVSAARPHLRLDFSTTGQVRG